ncbi:MAG: DUF547 domain-containing protein [Myxococcales bacterium]|nr:DUF547 domain-containing protein [Myxococcales bacterium]
MSTILALAIALMAPAADAPAAAGAATIDHGPWDALLKKYVKGDKVDYAGFAADPGLKAYVATIEKTDPASIKDAKDRLAFWINAYNAHTVAAVVAHWPGITSVSNVYPDFAFFKKKDKVIGGEKYALNDVENEIIRPRFKDPRIHAALNCASVSCPPLANFAFTGAKLDAQLDQVMRAFANDAARNEIEPGKDTVRLSEIFKWYADDFKPAGGPKAYLLKYLDGERKAALEKAAKVDFKPYDWNLNKT